MDVAVPAVSKADKATPTRDEEFGARVASIPLPKRGNRARAELLNKRGFTMRSEHRDNEQAYALYSAAVKADPAYEWSRYNLACELALLGRSDEALAHLLALRRLDTTAARDALRAAATDDDLRVLRSAPLFSRLTSNID
jgi:thioredoxin-like negative regulator of GroEL